MVDNIEAVDFTINGIVYIPNLNFRIMYFSSSCCPSILLCFICSLHWLATGRNIVAVVNRWSLKGDGIGMPLLTAVDAALNCLLYSWKVQDSTRLRLTMELLLPAFCKPDSINPNRGRNVLGTIVPNHGLNRSANWILSFRIVVWIVLQPRFYRSEQRTRYYRSESWWIVPNRDGTLITCILQTG